ncbi:MAG: hypothetical protein E7258_04775 [Lachnospiraceae bacterium]|nr:hypothetical protein [Lachnospiraceae bacterium]
MKLKNKKIVTLIMILVFVLSQSIVVLADYVGQPLAYDMANFPVDNTYANEYHLCMYSSSGDSSGNRYYSEYFSYVTYTSDTEVVLYLSRELISNDTGAKYYTFGRLSNSDINRTVKSLHYSKGEFSYTDDVISTYIDLEHNWMGSSGSNVLNKANGWLLYNSMKIFDSEENAQAYLDTGSLNGLIKDESKQYNADEIYLDDFYFEVHDSNELSQFYVTFFYTPSDYLVQNNGKIYLDYDLSIDYSFLSGAIDMSDFINPSGSIELPCVQGQNVYTWNLDVWNFVSDTAPTWFAEFVEGAILGDELFIDLGGISLGDIGGNTFVQIEKSCCNVNVYPILNNQRGKTYSGAIDFLNPQNSYYNSNTPDSMGNYLSDGNYTTNDGYYYTDVSKDDFGNNVYNYYYITDNSKTEIDNGSSGGGNGNGIQHHYHEHRHDVDVNINGSFGGGSSSNGNDITIEDDDFTADGLRSALEDGYGIFDLVSTEKDNDGFMALLTDFVGSMDDDMNNLIGFGMGTTVVLAIILRLLNR